MASVPPVETSTQRRVLFTLFLFFFAEWNRAQTPLSNRTSGVLVSQHDRKSPMIADTSPLGHIGPPSLPTNKTNNLRLQTDQYNDRLGTFFSNLSWTDRQVLALHFAERLSSWEIHVILNMSMSDVLCRIQRLRKIARESIQASRGATSSQLSLK